MHFTTSLIAILTFFSIQLTYAPIAHCEKIPPAVVFLYPHTIDTQHFSFIALKHAHDGFTQAGIPSTMIPVSQKNLQASLTYLDSHPELVVVIGSELKEVALLTSKDYQKTHFLIENAEDISNNVSPFTLDNNALWYFSGIFAGKLSSSNIGIISTYKQDDILINPLLKAFTLGVQITNPTATVFFIQSQTIGSSNDAIPRIHSANIDTIAMHTHDPSWNTALQNANISVVYSEHCNGHLGINPSWYLKQHLGKILVQTRLHMWHPQKITYSIGHGGMDISIGDSVDESLKHTLLQEHANLTSKNHPLHELSQVVHSNFFTSLFKKHKQQQNLYILPCIN